MFLLKQPGAQINIELGFFVVIIPPIHTAMRRSLHNSLGVTNIESTFAGDPLITNMNRRND